MYSFFNNYPYEGANRGATWNPIKGKCPHQCSYCYMTKMYKRYKWDTEFKLDEKCFKDNLGKDRYIFVGSSTDMWADIAPDDWINTVLTHLRQRPNNQYFFQSKNPERFGDFTLPENSIICTTIETNRQDILDKYSKAPELGNRHYGMIRCNHKSMVTIEPIMDFDIIGLRQLIYDIKPFQVNIGEDSGHNKLPEPPAEKVLALIAELEKFTKVNQKDNLKRLLREVENGTKGS